MHLAEVAACHRILALVLGEPAEVDPSSREKAYRAPEALASSSDGESEPGPPPVPAEAPLESPDAAATPSPRPVASRIPDYLREPEPAVRRWRLGVGIAAVILVLVAVLGLTGRFGGRNLVGEWLGTEGSATEEPRGQGAEIGASSGGAAEEASGGMDSRLKAAAGQTTGLPSGKTAPGAAETRPAGGPSGKESGSTGPGPGPAAVPGPSESPAPKPASEGPKPTDVAKKLPKGNDLPKGLVPPPGTTGADAQRQPPSAVKGPVAADAAKPAPQVGYLVSAKEVLLRFDTRTGVWRCLAARAEPASGEKPVAGSGGAGPVPPALFAGDRLLSLPAFRPLIGLGGQAKVQLIGGTMVELLAPDAQSAGGLSIEYGQVLLKPEEAGAARLRMRLGERTGLVTFRDAESTLAIEARRQDAQGGDPETQPGSMVADLYVTSGKIGWQEDAGQPPIELEAPIRRPWGEHAVEPKVSQQFPKWVYSSDTTGSLDQRGALTLERELSGGRPANLVLRELVDFKLKEVRSLAVRSLALIGDFEPMLRALDDPDQKFYWDDCVEQLRAGVMRRPASAAAVRSAMERFYGGAGARLYEMLWKYSQALQAADSQVLIDTLEHQTLAFRVVALWNLKSAYGMTLQYRPEEPAGKRQVAVQRWKDRLKLGLTPRGASPTRGGKIAPSEVPPADGLPAAREPL